MLLLLLLLLLSPLVLPLLRTGGATDKRSDPALDLGDLALVNAVHALYRAVGNSAWHTAIVVAAVGRSVERRGERA